jgi:hypothetical protein
MPPQKASIPPPPGRKLPFNVFFSAPGVSDGFGVAKQKKMAHGGKLAGEARKGEWAKRGISDTPLGCEAQGAGRLGFSSSTTRSGAGGRVY